MPVDSTSTAALAYANIEVDPNILSKYTHAVAIYSAPHDKGWLYRIECKEPKAYDAFSEALTATEIHLKGRCFLPILDDGGRTHGKIVLNPSKDVFESTSVWRQPLAPQNENLQNENRPPTPQPTSSQDENQPLASSQNENELLIPGLKRLSKQLRVDFATNVHGSEGKRRRDPTRTIYEENALSEAKPPATKKARAATKCTDGDAAVPEKAAPKSKAEYSFAEKALDAVNALHAEAVAAKDETIRTLTSALAMREELVRTQASLIALLQRGSTHSP